jgi:hypothetical protein
MARPNLRGSDDLPDGDSMTPVELRALAQNLDVYHTRAEHKIAAAYLRACADAVPVATAGVCCRIVRLGVWDEGVVHDGGCRGRHGGSLGKTDYLYAAPVVAQPWSESDAVALAHRAGFAGTAWHVGPEELVHLLNMVAAPVEQPLTHMQIVLLWGHRSDGPSTEEIVSFARAVERAVRGQS